MLGSGGARGLAHIGVLKAIEEYNIPIDMIIGTSVGALIGGIYASGMDVASMEKIVRKVDKMMVAKILMPKLFSGGFIDNRKVMDFIVKLVGDVKIEDMKMQFTTVATDFITGEEVIINSGLLAEAILASIAIPTIFQPVFQHNHYLIDGGLSNPLPVSVAKKMGAQKIIAVNVSPNPKRITKKHKKVKSEEISLLIKKLPALFTNLFNESKQRLPFSDADNKMEECEIVRLYSPSIFNIFFQSISISTNNLMMQHLRHAKPDILISPNIGDYDLLEFYKGTEIIKRGYDATLKSLKEIQLDR